MADIIDEANELEQLQITAALASRKQGTMTFIGRCHYCDDPLLNVHFCDKDCRDDFEKELKLRAQRRAA